MTAMSWAARPVEDTPPAVTEARGVRPSLAESRGARSSFDDPESFGAVFDTHFAEIHRYVAQRLGADHAEDVVAETFLAAFRKRARYDPSRATVRAWLYGIATNLIGKHRRLEVRTLRALGRHGPEADAPGHEERVAVRVSAESLRPDLAAALAGLDRRDRDVVLLVALAGLSHEEISTALGIPYGTVGSRLSRARKKLRVALGGVNPMLDPEEAGRG
ncbi:DNA-directed RNA polymerase sigma-70 factor [Planobispora longispora]|uniref:DNA-directed RNA polymerase sigma-70 factor n=2 Tax=Planobispora longispora TaxID=28887 RepID=A0A8J3RP47_9ACTN|nr:RNA polymerase sigma factor [Planobispora longispora]BFE82806.1 RNA polymerase sigma factor [Planobispora longispora]GIH78548.1 DNA-directed RNA polymerase sigma-70 factor [Planobispora longispora]